MATDVLEPVAGGRADYPDEFLKGMIEGLFLDYNGYLRSLAWTLRGLARTIDRIGGADVLLSTLSAKIYEAELSYAVKDGQLDAVTNELRHQLDQTEKPETRVRLEELAEAISAHIK